MWLHSFRGKPNEYTKEMEYYSDNIIQYLELQNLANGISYFELHTFSEKSFFFSFNRFIIEKAMEIV